MVIGATTNYCICTTTEIVSVEEIFKMSVKRQATTELNHDNWDQDDPADHEEMGSFKIAPKEMLEKRVIRTAKRRTQVAGDEVTYFHLKYLLFH